MKTITIALAVSTLPLATTIRANEVGETSWEHAPSDYKAPPGLVKGGAFIDLIRPMPVGPAGLRTGIWGSKNVGPRNVENGLESPDWSYWCMNVHHAEDGKEHMFAVRWPESDPRGHMAWFSSVVVHAVADNPAGPFKVLEEIGPGHNVNWYRAKDGTHVLCVNGGGYSADSLAGPWAKRDIVYDTRGTDSGEMSNHTFTRREDGSLLMVSRGGRTWISEDGLKPYRKITDKSAYPPIKGAFEDPVVWRDEVQYHLIVNDWFGRTAFYLRSKDGVRWVWDAGVAYDTAVARHPDGSRENWYKFERANVRQDAFGRATHIYFAVIDTRKDIDLANDGHGSKIIALPLTVQRRLDIINPAPIDAATREIQVRIRAEPGFSPKDEVDTDSLRFGAPTEVNFGRGCRVTATRTDGADLVVSFSAKGHGFGDADFVGKLLGRDRKGELLFGYARLPGQSFAEPIVDAPPAVFDSAGAHLTVENFGLSASRRGNAILTLTGPDGVKRATSAAIPAIPPYGAFSATIPVNFTALRGAASIPVSLSLDCGGAPKTVESTLTLLTPGKTELTALTLRSAGGDRCGWSRSADNKGVAGNPLKIGSRAFATGIGTHAPSEQSWLLDGSFSELSLQAGVQSELKQGSVRVEILGDGKRLHLTQPLKGGDEPVSISVPVKGVHRLQLIATDAGDGNGGDHVVYGDPVLRSLAGGASTLKP